MERWTYTNKTRIFYQYSHLKSSLKCSWVVSSSIFYHNTVCSMYCYKRTPRARLLFVTERYLVEALWEKMRPTFTESKSTICP